MNQKKGERALKQSNTKDLEKYNADLRKQISEADDKKGDAAKKAEDKAM